MLKGTRSYLILIAVTVVGVLITFLLPPIPQRLNFHHFADIRMIWGISNFWNVVSNVLFLIVGFLGFFAIKRQWQAGNFINLREAIVFFLIFLGLVLTSIGSSYYHLAPDNDRLAWDRIPITLVFMAFLSFIIMERVSFRVGFWLLIPLILFGMGSVWYWIWSESMGRGDLRPYGFMQVYSIAIILIILCLFPKSYPSTKSILFVIIFYVFATVFQFMDLHIYQIGSLLSGHTLKHIFAAIGTYWFVVMVDELENRKLPPPVLFSES